MPHRPITERRPCMRPRPTPPCKGPRPFLPPRTLPHHSNSATRHHPPPGYSAVANNGSPSVFTSSMRRYSPANATESAQSGALVGSSTYSVAAPASSSYAAWRYSKMLWRTTQSSCTLAARGGWVFVMRSTCQSAFSLRKGVSTTTRMLACWWLNRLMDATLGPCMSASRNGEIYQVGG